MGKDVSETALLKKSLTPSVAKKNLIEPLMLIRERPKAVQHKISRGGGITFAIYAERPTRRSRRVFHKKFFVREFRRVASRPRLPNDQYHSAKTISGVIPIGDP